MNRKIMIWVCLCWLNIGSIWAETTEGDPNVAELVRAVRQSEMWMHDCNSIYLRVKGHWTKTPEGIAKRRAEIRQEMGIEDPNITQFPGLRQTSVHSLEFAVDRQRVRYCTDDPGYWRQLKVWDGNELRIHEKYYHHSQEHYVLESKISERMFNELFPCHYGWPRSQAHSFWYDPMDVNSLMSLYGYVDRFELVGKESYRDIPCYALDFQVRTNYTRRWFVGRADGFLYGIQKRYHGIVSSEHWWSDYRQVVPGGWFPMKSSWCFYDTTPEGELQLRSTCNLETVDLTVNESLDNLFEVLIPPGIMVIDRRSGNERTYKFWPSLQNKEIASFDNIQLASPLPPKNIPLLIAFVDLEQRPSRHILKTLTEQLASSPHSKAHLIVIQASPISTDTLEHWNETLKLTAGIATVTGDVDAVRWSWGVKSLPWLILTDEEHIVTGEGLSFDEVLKRLK